MSQEQVFVFLTPGPGSRWVGLSYVSEIASSRETLWDQDLGTVTETGVDIPDENLDSLPFHLSLYSSRDLILLATNDYVGDTGEGNLRRDGDGNEMAIDGSEGIADGVYLARSTVVDGNGTVFCVSDVVDWEGSE